MRKFSVYLGECNPNNGRLLYKIVGIDPKSIDVIDPQERCAFLGAVTKNIDVTTIILKNGVKFDVLETPADVWDMVHEDKDDENPWRK